MNIKLNILTAAMLAVVSTAATAAVPNPEPVPPIYNSGPQGAGVASTDMSLAERTAYANYEAVMQIAEARIHATSCSSSEGEFNMNAFSDGKVGSPSTNYATVVSDGGSFTVKTSSLAPNPLPPAGNNWGQQMQTAQNPASGILKLRSVANYTALLAYNSANNMMESTSSVSVIGANGKFDKYYGKVIKDFYRGAWDGNPDNPEYYNIYDWGLQALDKEGYPVNKYWQRSKSHRSDGSIGRTVFVKDRLVGATACRIIIDTYGENNADFFSQTGKLKIQPNVLPGSNGGNVAEFTTYPW